MDVAISSFAGSVLLVLAILLGIGSALGTYINSRKLQGEVFEKPFVYFAGGMLLVVLSLVAVTFLQGVWAADVVRIVHDVSFIAGFALMLTASVKITRHLQSLDKFVKKLK